MCKSPSLDDLIREAIPSNIVDPTALEDGVLGEPIHEHIFLKNIKQAFA